jgi:16S rRNA C967 or C1407 C5-methylase (RsmB/RsmF family)/NOL1/NOP2/fmu family ribosome biogenesis protein
MMLPEKFLERLASQPYINAAGLTAALQQPAGQSVRVNLRKWHYPVTGYERVQWEPDGFYLPGKPLFAPDPLFHAGVYYPQESSGMFTGELFRQLTAGRSGLRVLDLCGAPGGKSTHLSSLIGDDGLLVANEVIGSRAAVLAENITKWGMGNTVVTQSDPSRFAALPGFFDVIVADAPCSGEGMFRSPVAVQEWSLSNARLCSERQRRIVMEAWQALRPGGIFIYSTCTFNPAENEHNVSWLGESTGAESLAADISGLYGITEIRYKGVTGYGFHPGRVRGEGFFIAALRKPSQGGDDECPNNEIPGSGDRSFGSRNTGSLNPGGREDRIQGSRENRKTGSRHPGGNMSRDSRAGMQPSAKAYEVAESLASFGRERLTVSDGRIIALAADAGLISQLSGSLNVIKYGTMIGDIKNSILIPANDLAMSVRRIPGTFAEHDLSRDEALAYLRLEPMRPERMPEGRVLVRYRGVALGFVNNLGSRVNNGYHRQWRLRMAAPPDYREIL